MMRFFRRMTDERGVALPVAMAVLFTVAGLATVAARAAIVSNNQSFRDNNAKRAVQAAGGGLQAARYQINLLQPGSDQCVVKNAGTGALSNAATSGGWCSPQTEDLGDGATSTFYASAATPGTQNGISVVRRTVVSTGTVNGVRRRAVISMSAATGSPLFPPGYSLYSRDSVDVMNNMRVTGGIGSNGNVTIKNNAYVCGAVTAGPGGTVRIGTNFTQCAGAPAPATASEPFPLQPVDLSGAKASNDNNRITNMKASPPVDPRDTCSNCSRVEWTESTKVLRLTNNAVLNLSGNNYLFCKVEVESTATLQIASRTTPLRIFIDSPQNCPGVSGAGNLTLDGTVTNLSSNPATLLFLVAGSATVPTTVNLPSGEATMGIYAPNSIVDFKNNLVYTGALVAKTIKLKNNAQINWDPRINDLSSGSDIRFYEPGTGSYKECTGTPTGTAPDSGC
jgi:Tfp pilus assembly protein PilX